MNRQDIIEQRNKIIKYTLFIETVCYLTSHGNEYYVEIEIPILPRPKLVRSVNYANKDYTDNRRRHSNELLEYLGIV